MKTPKAPSNSDFADAMAIFATSTNTLASLEAKRAEALAAVNAKFDKPIEESQQKLEETKAVIERYATAHREALLMGNSKTIEVMGIQYGWRTKAASLKPCEGITWDQVLQRVKKKFPEGVRVTEELDKPVIKAFASVPGAQAKLVKSCGLELSKEETFFVKLKD